MARIVNAKYSTLIGTAGDIKKLLEMLAGSRSAVVNMEGSNLVVLNKPLEPKQFDQVLRVTPGEGGFKI